MNDHPSPLRYPGGKHFLTSFLTQVIRLNGVEGGSYVEPFAGGAGAALGLLFNEVVYDIHINDIDVGIYSFWDSVLHDTDAFIKLIIDTPVNVTTWRKQRQIRRDPANHSKLQVGFSTFYLNRCNRSGALTGGPIGGLRQDGNYSIDVRFNKRTLQRRIERIAIYQDRIHVSQKDAVRLLQVKGKENWSRSDVLVYLDPPYYSKGKRLYSRFFNDDDHTRLARFLSSSVSFRWLVSYDDASAIHKLYSAEKNILLTDYFMQTVRVGRELVIASTDCDLPSGYFVHNT